MRHVAPLSFAIALTAVGCECQETLYRAAPVERVEITARGLFDAGDETISRGSLRAPIYRLDAHPDRYEATLTVGYGQYDILLADEADRAYAPAEYTGGEDAFALEMHRSGMRRVDDERTLVEHDFETARLRAFIRGVEYIDAKPTVDFAIDLATGALRADVTGSLVAVDGHDTTPRPYTAQLDAVASIECWREGPDGQMIDPWYDTGDRTLCPRDLDTLPKTSETPAPPWSLDGPQDEMVCGI